jgi:hypothetical protein
MTATQMSIGTRIGILEENTMAWKTLQVMMIDPMKYVPESSIDIGKSHALICAV